MGDYEDYEFKSTAQTRDISRIMAEQVLAEVNIIGPHLQT